MHDGVVIRIGSAHDAVRHRRRHHTRAFFRSVRRAEKRVVVEEIFTLRHGLQFFEFQPRGVLPVKRGLVIAGERGEGAGVGLFIEG